MKKMRRMFSGCSFYNKKKKGDSWTGSEMREMAEVLRNPTCRDELVLDEILRDFRRCYVYPAISTILVALIIIFFLCYIAG